MTSERRTGGRDARERLSDADEPRLFEPEYGAYYRARAYLIEGTGLVFLSLLLLFFVDGAFELAASLAPAWIGITIVRMHFRGRRLTAEEAERSRRLFERTADELTGRPRRSRVPIHVWLPWMRVALYAVVALGALMVIR